MDPLFVALSKCHSSGCKWAGCTSSSYFFHHGIFLSHLYRDLNFYKMFLIGLFRQTISKCYIFGKNYQTVFSFAFVLIYFIRDRMHGLMITEHEKRMMDKNLLSTPPSSIRLQGRN